jgi:hypothetical protein
MYEDRLLCSVSNFPQPKGQVENFASGNNPLWIVDCFNRSRPACQHTGRMTSTNYNSDKGAESLSNVIPEDPEFRESHALTVA